MEIFDTRVVARPPPPRPWRRSANPHYTIEESCLTSNRIRHRRPAERLDTQKHHLRQTVLPHPLPKGHSRPVVLHVNPRHNFGHRNRRARTIVLRGSSLQVGHDGVMRVNLRQESKTRGKTTGYIYARELSPSVPFLPSATPQNLVSLAVSGILSISVGRFPTFSFSNWCHGVRLGRWKVQAKDRTSVALGDKQWLDLCGQLVTRTAKLLIAPGVLSVLSGWLADWGVCPVEGPREAKRPFSTAVGAGPVA